MEPRIIRFPDIPLTIPISPLEEHVVEKKEIPKPSDANTKDKAQPDSSQLEKKEDAKLQEQIVSQSLLAATTTAPTELVETKDASKFHSAIEEAKNDGKQQDIETRLFGTKDSKWFGAFVHTYEIEQYKDMTMLLTHDSKGGVAVKRSGDIVSVFKHPASPVRSILEIIIPEAIKKGGTHLDCFAGRLPEMYSKFGLVPVAKVKFDENFMPDGWNKARDGTPDIILMAFDKEATIEKDPRIQGPLIKKAIAELPYSSYDEAVEIQKAFVKSKINR